MQIAQNCGVYHPPFSDTPNGHETWLEDIEHISSYFLVKKKLVFAHVMPPRMSSYGLCFPKKYPPGWWFGP